jgi:secondary thiamine-phosphate synthase enzyme
MIYQKEITLPQFSRGFHLITELIERELGELPEIGILNIFLKHTSAALSINENADPDVRADMEKISSKLIPENMPYYEHNLEGSDDMPAHMKSSLFGTSLTIPVTGKSINLGTWQGIYLCEFRNHSGRRSIVLTVFS